MTRAISLWQPWGSLWLSPHKIHETRHWPTKHRGWLLVHAAKKFIKGFYQTDPLLEILADEFGDDWALKLPTGALIGMVNIIACDRTEDIYFPGINTGTSDYHCGDFSEGRYGWRRGEFRRFATPIPYRGQQGMFDVPDSILPMEPSP